MLCNCCNLKRIGPKIPPFGFFWCNDDHIQCLCCHNAQEHHCGVCGKRTKFIQMTLFDEPMPAMTPQILPSEVDSATLTANENVDIATNDDGSSSLENAAAVHNEPDTTKQPILQLRSIGVQTSLTESKYTQCYRRTFYSKKWNRLKTEFSSPRSMRSQLTDASSAKSIQFQELGNSKKRKKRSTPKTVSEEEAKNKSKRKADVAHNERYKKIIDTMREQSGTVSSDLNELTISTSEIMSLGSESFETAIFEKIVKAVDPPLLETTHIMHPLPFERQCIHRHEPEQFSMPRIREKSVMSEVCNVYRASFNPFTDKQKSNMKSSIRAGGKTTVLEPPPQFNNVECCNEMSFKYLAKRARDYKDEPQSAHAVLSNRRPIICPDSNCMQRIFLSDFSSHLVMGHAAIPVERILPHQCKNFFLDPRAILFNEQKCQMIYLLREKITNLGSSDYKDYLPIVVLTTRFDAAYSRNHKNNHSDGLLAIWAVGIVPETYPIYVSLTVFESTDCNSRLHASVSSQLYSVQSSKEMKHIVECAQPLLLNVQEVKLLTHDYTRLMQLQIVAH